MPQPKKILVSWSSGKDSAWSLHLLRQQGEWEIAGLLTTFNAEFDRVAMHAVRRALVEKQAAAAGLPLWTVPLPWPCSNEEYERLMAAACQRAVEEGISAVAFGDLFLQDIREYRERQMRDTGLQPVFPVWNIPTADLAAEMIRAGLRAKITCVDPRALSRDFAGREFDSELLAALPKGIDRCGENGEFHTFVYDGPMLEHPIHVMPGEVVERDGFVFADLMEGS